MARKMRRSKGMMMRKRVHRGKRVSGSTMIKKRVRRGRNQ